MDTLTPGILVKRKDGTFFSNGMRTVRIIDTPQGEKNYSDRYWIDTRTEDHPFNTHIHHTSVEPVVEPVAAATTAYPDDNPKTVIGLTKPSMAPIPPIAILHLGKAMMDGRKKYGLMNWREKTVSATIYYDAAMRHLMSWYDGEENAQDSGVHHLGHAMACLAIVLDAQSIGKLNDDRPVKGMFAEAVAANTKAL